METIAKTSKITFKDFITNCKVSDCGGGDYAVNYGYDTDLGYNVNISDAWIITDSYGVQEDLNDAQRELLFLQIDEYKEDNSIDTSDFESPWVTTGEFPLSW